MFILVLLLCCHVYQCSLRGFGTSPTRGGLDSSRTAKTEGRNEKKEGEKVLSTATSQLWGPRFKSGHGDRLS
jgi:hypothetical protein